ncbi:SCO0930 family lipoprotein [Streptomyces sp. NPDC095613]|uniref:SCO0930 family lipoprotein n=1 Tax=Streptomyces sp. NPDC095613 TaxID=3155540 RepID=UPI00331B8AEE
MNTWRNASLAVTAVAVLALTTACGQEQGTNTNGQSVGVANPAGQPGAAGSGTGYASGGTGAAAGTGAGAPAGGAPAEAKPAGQLAVTEDAKLGEVLTDSEGFTLYRFDKDTPKPPKSNCEGDCAKTWPIVEAGDAKAPTGTDAALLGEVTRPDGTKQLTIDGWPMYRYVKDTKPGDANGQGVGGTWYASAPDGKKATASGSASEVSNAGLSVRNDPKLGEIVVDSKGMTVYRFTKDSAWPMKTACTGECLDKWPVVAPVNKADFDGVTTKGAVTFDRPDGIKQQTLDCSPIYTFAGDKKPGDTNGQGVGGTWFAVTPDNKLVEAAE